MISQVLDEQINLSISLNIFLMPSRAVKGSDSGSKKDHRWTTLAALHPGVITEVERGGISYLDGSRPRYRLKIF